MVRFETLHDAAEEQTSKQTLQMDQVIKLSHWYNYLVSMYLNCGRYLTAFTGNTLQIIECAPPLPNCYRQYHVHVQVSNMFTRCHTKRWYSTICGQYAWSSFTYYIVPLISTRWQQYTQLIKKCVAREPVGNNCRHTSTTAIIKKTNVN